MLFPEEDAPELKKWIVKRLENTSDADADVLADYVMALLRHDGGVDSVRKLLEDEVPVFLKEEKDSAIFINDVFEAMEYRSYLPNPPPRPPKQQSQQEKLQQKHQQQLELMEQLQRQLNGGGQGQPQSQSHQTFGLSYDDSPAMMSQGRGYPLPPQSQHFTNGPASRKRGHHDLDNSNAHQQNGWGQGNSGRSIKQARKGALRGGDSADASSGFPQPGMPEPSRIGYFDPQTATAEFMRQLTQMSQQMGLPPPNFGAMNPAPGSGGGRGKGKKKARCRDFDKKGFCPRGFNCNFVHTADNDYFPAQLGAPAAQQPQKAWEQNDEYDPSNALMPGIFPPYPTSFQPTPDYMFEGNGFDAGKPRQHQHSKQQKNGAGGNRGHSRYTKRAPFSAEGAVYDKSNTTVVVEQIPEENFEESQVREFFSQFGNIVEVKMQPYKRLAIVKYETWEQADAAYQSPKVIFENRFVRVYWYKEPLDEQRAGKKPAKNGSSAHSAAADTAEEGEVVESEPIDMEEFTRKQEEAQRTHEEKQKKLEEIERERQAVEKKQLELLEKAAKAKAELVARLAKKNGGDKGGSEGESDTHRTRTEDLRAQLALLENEAKSLGLDPDAAEDGLSYYSTSTHDYSSGGGYRGRGRGRGRGGYVARGRGGYYRGGGGGYGGDVHAAYAAYSLDNRPKKVVVTGVDLTENGRDEMLRQYLFGIGEFTDIQSTSTSTEIAFKDRKTAEKFYNMVVLNGNVVPGIEGQVELSWVGGSGGSGSSAPDTPRTGTPGVGGAGSNGHKKEEDQEEGEVDQDDGDHDHDDNDVKITLNRPSQPDRVQDLNEMDYEVADDDEGGWGY